MSCVYKGEIIESEQSTRSRGGTELMRDRLIKGVSPNMLANVAIHVSRVRHIYEDVPNILWLHDLHNDPEVTKLSDPEYRKQFVKIVFVSEWQAQMYHLTHGIPYSEFVVIPNAIEPFDVVEKSTDDPVRIIYHTTPHRGLNIAYGAVDAISRATDVPIHFDVFSSFGVYGWEARDEPYRKLFDAIDQHPSMTYHGWASNDVVRKALVDSHIFFYPSIWPETSCLAMIEALCAGVIPVYPNFAALPETAGKSGFMYHWDESQQVHANTAANSLVKAIRTVKEHPEYKKVAQSLQIGYNGSYQWAAVEPLWVALLQTLSKD